MPELRPEVVAWLDRVEQLGLRPFPRDDARPVSDYPKMPPHTCYLSSRTLAEVYPELAVRYGRLSFRLGGAQVEIDHAWNVTTDGTIVDSTWTPPRGAEEVTYREDPGQ
jgi:hypothetical protein